MTTGQYDMWINYSCAGTFDSKIFISTRNAYVSSNELRTRFTLCSVHWRHNGCDSVSNHQPHDCLLRQPLIQTQIKENIKAPCHRPLCGEFTGDRWIPAQMASNAENVSIWWRHHVCIARDFIMADFTLTVYCSVPMIPVLVKQTWRISINLSIICLDNTLHPKRYTCGFHFYCALLWYHISLVMANFAISPVRIR